jgi:hypothetical protein
MIESFKDLPFLYSEDKIKPEEIDNVLREKMGIGFAECSQALCDSLKARAEEVAQELPSLAPHGDYSKMTEDPEAIATFLRDEAAKPENWDIDLIQVKKDSSQLMEMVFVNKTVDDGDILRGFVFVGLSGKIRHAFVQTHW